MVSSIRYSHFVLYIQRVFRVFSNSHKRRRPQLGQEAISFSGSSIEPQVGP